MRPTKKGEKGEIGQIKMCDRGNQKVRRGKKVPEMRGQMRTGDNQDNGRVKMVFYA